MSAYVTLAETSRVPADRALRVCIGEREFAILKINEAYYALDGCCPHRGGPLGEGSVENGYLYCPLHGWKFDARTGECIDNPEKQVKAYPVRVENGKVQICVP